MNHSLTASRQPLVCKMLNHHCSSYPGSNFATWTRWPGTWPPPGCCLRSTFVCFASFSFLCHFLLPHWLCARRLFTAVYNVVLTKIQIGTMVGVFNVVPLYISTKSHGKQLMLWNMLLWCLSLVCPNFATRSKGGCLSSISKSWR